MKYITLLFILSGVSVMATPNFHDSKIIRKLENGKVQKFNGNDYKIVPRKPTRKKAKRIKNHVVLLVGFGPQGTLTNQVNNGIAIISNKNSIIGAAQYIREVWHNDKFGVDASLQLQTNRTGLIGVGIGF